MHRRPGEGRPIRTSPGRTRAGPEDLVPLDHADREPDQVELARLHHAGMFGHLAAEQRGPHLPAALGHPGHQLGHPGRLDRARGDVVEEEQRLGPLAHQVVHAHGHQVDPRVSRRPVASATSALVPTPSVPATSTGWR